MKKDKEKQNKANKLDIDGDGNISFAEAFPYWFDKLRIFPRVFISVYIYMFYQVAQWFMLLENPNNAQAGLVSVVVGAGAGWFAIYVNGKATKIKNKD